MGPKYEFTDETLVWKGHLLHRIKSLSTGELGGFIEKEDNLSQDGDCWVDDEATVFGDAHVYGGAQVSDYAEVYGKAEIHDDCWINARASVYGNAEVCGKAEVYDNARVFDNAIIHGETFVYGNAHISGNASIYGKARVYDDVQVYNNAEVYGDARVQDSAEVYGEAKVYGKANVHDNAHVYGSARICSDAEVYGNACVYGNTKVYGSAKVHGDIKISRGEYSSGEYHKNKSATDSPKDIVQDFIYKVDDSSRLKIETGYDSVEEFFSAGVENDDSLNALVICSVDTRLPLIKLEKTEKDNKLAYKFIVDITITNGDNFRVKSTIETQEQLTQKLEQTIEALRQYPEFGKYVDDLENCL